MAQRQTSFRIRDLRSETDCFTIIKPDAIELGITQDIMQRIGELGLVLYGRQELHLDIEDVRAVWPLISAPGISKTVPYMTRRSVEIGMIHGPDATIAMCGLKQQLRREYPSAPPISVIHTTDCDEELRRCAQHFYGEAGL